MSKKNERHLETDALETNTVVLKDGTTSTATRSSNNVFADLGFEDAAELKFKTQLVYRIQCILEERGLTQAQAAKIIRVDQPRLSKMLRGEFLSLSSDKLFDILNRLGRRVEIRVLESEVSSEEARTLLVV